MGSWTNLPVTGGGPSGIQIVKAASPSGGFTISQPWVNTPGGNLAQITGWEASITLTETSDLYIHIYMNLFYTAAAECIVGYQIDSDTPVPTNYESWGIVGSSSRTVVVADVIEDMAPGTYLIKAMAARSTANVSLINTTTNNSASKIILTAFPTT